VRQTAGYIMGNGWMWAVLKKLPFGMGTWWREHEEDMEYVVEYLVWICAWEVLPMCSIYVAKLRPKPSENDQRAVKLSE
jgi:hypothetical protein